MKNCTEHYCIEQGSAGIALLYNRESGSLRYEVLWEGEPLTRPSPLGIRTGAGDFTDGLRLVESTTRRVSHSYRLASGGKKAVCAGEGVEQTLTFKRDGVEDTPIQIIVRAYEDGVAFRYAIPWHVQGDALEVYGEETGLVIAPKTTGWAHRLIKSYEEHYDPRSFEELDGGVFGMPVLLRFPGGLYGLLTEAGVYADYCASHIEGAGDGAGLLRFCFAPDQQEPVRTEAPFATPWRALLLGDLARLTISTLVTDLNPPCALEDTGWIRPGRANWTWWNDDPTTDLDTAKRYVDFAAEMGWEYFLADAGWQAEWVPELVRHGTEKGLGIFIWSHYEDLDTPEKIERLFPLWSSWGVKGMKIDFFESDSQARMRNHEQIAIAAEKYQLMLNFHGCTKPTGMERRYPHILTYEAVLGAEYYKWPDDGFPMPTARHNCTIPFTRNIIGPADYTPVTFSNNQGMITWAHSVALLAVLHSNLMCISDKPAWLESSAAKPFLMHCPVAWDETRLIEGAVGEYITLARRSGERWFVGAICADASREAVIPLGFLGGGTYQADLYTDGDTDTKIHTETRTVTAADTLTIPLRTNGGCAVELTPAHA